MKKRFLWPVFWDFFIPVFVLIIITIIFRITDVDLKIARHFYVPSLELGFRETAYPWWFFYKYGAIPSIVSVLIAGLFFAIGFFNDILKQYRLRSLFVILLMTIAPGIIVNTIFKDHWGRPRPKQCIKFHGEYAFEKIWTPDFVNTDCKSFPGGHASAAFFMFFPFFLYRAYRKKKRAVMWLFIGLVYGSLVSYARIFQGAHFTSDCLWAGGFDYLTALVLYYALRLRKDALTRTFHEKSK
jgi:lipid A 4'-phosphatase